MTIPTVLPRSRIRIGTTSIRVRIRHVLTGMIRGSPGMVREDVPATRAAGQAMPRVGDKANGNPATARAGGQGNLASRARVVPAEGQGNPGSLDKAAVRGSRVSPVNRGRVDVRANPGSLAKAAVRVKAVSPVNRDRVDVRANPGSLDRVAVRGSRVSPVNRGRVDVRVNPVSLVNLAKVVVRASPASLSNLGKAVVRANPVSRSSLGRVAVRANPVSHSSLGRVDVRASPVSLVLARVPANRHSSRPGRKAPLPRPKSRSRDNRHSPASPDNQDDRLIRKSLVHPNRLEVNLLS